MKLSPEQANILERMIDAHGVVDVVKEITTICQLKENHARVHMRSRSLAGRWRLNAFRLSGVKLEDV